MILGAGLGLLLLAAILAHRHLNLAIATILALLMVIMLGGEGVVSRRLLQPLQDPYVSHPRLNWQAENIIVVLGAGVVRWPASASASLWPGTLAYPRLFRAAELWHQCQSSARHCRILLSGGDPWRLGASEAEVYAQALHDLGVPAELIIKESRSANTRQNAAFSAALLAQTNPAYTVLVSSAYHLRRASACFRAYGVRFTPVSSDLLGPGGGWLPSAYNLALSDLALHEWGGLFRDRLLVWLGRP